MIIREELFTHEQNGLVARKQQPHSSIPTQFSSHSSAFVSLLFSPTPPFAQPLLRNAPVDNQILFAMSVQETAPQREADNGELQKTKKDSGTEEEAKFIVTEANFPSHVQVRFRSSTFPKQTPDAPFKVPSNLTRFGLSEIVNHLLENGS